MRAPTTAVIGMLCLLAACSAPRATGAATATLSEYLIEVDQPDLASGALFTVSNQGEFGHTLVVSDESGAVVTATDLIAPGESVTLAADWNPGRYRLTCRIVVAPGDGQIVDHYAEGMSSDLGIAG